MSSDEVVKKLKAQLRDLRKKYKEVRQENKEIWEKQRNTTAANMCISAGNVWKFVGHMTCIANIATL